MSVVDTCTDDMSCNRTERAGRAKVSVHSGEQVSLHPHTGDAGSSNDSLSECDGLAAGCGDFRFQWNLLLSRDQWRQTSCPFDSVWWNGPHLRLDFDDALNTYAQLLTQIFCLFFIS